MRPSQGVIEVATMTGTLRGPWAGITPSGRPVRLTVVIHFPWDLAVGPFAGERIYLDRAAFGAGYGGRSPSGLRIATTISR